MKTIVQSAAVLMVGGIIFSFDLGHVSAQDGGGNAGVTIQLPVLGVSVDAAGVLNIKPFPDADGSLAMARRQIAAAQLNVDVQKRSAMRMVSLKRLERAIDARITAGQPLDDVMRNLAGLQRIEYVFLLPDDNDIVIAGPAEGFFTNLAGRVVGIHSGLPTVLLDDLLVAMRVFRDQQSVNTWVAVSIDPTADGLRNLSELRKKIPSRIADHQRTSITLGLADQLQDALGMSNIRVYGIPRQSNMARVLVEADYRMKLMAVGTELPPIRMTTFVGALKGAPDGMQRWWLTPVDKCVKQSQDQCSMQLVGRGVQLKTENLVGGLAAAKQPQNKPSKAARTYASSFTKNYQALSERRPVYAQLRNAVDALVACAWIVKQNGYVKSKWAPSLLLDEDRLPVAELPDMKQAPAAANAVWKGRVLVLPVGGGVSIQASDLIQSENLLPNKGKQLDNAAANIQMPAGDHWWWD